MTTPGKYNITAYQGATFKLDLTWSIGGTPVNLTGYTAAMQVRKNSSSDAILDLESGSEITLGGTAGTISVRASSTTMGSATPGQYFYDLELDSGSEVTRLLQGQFNIDGGVTQ